MKTLKELKRGKDNTSKMNFILFILVCFITLSFTVGYSLLNKDLKISGEAFFRPKEDLRITDVKLYEVTDDARSSYSNYSKSVMNAGFDLTNLASTISYKVTFTNFSNIEMMVSDVTQVVDNSNIYYDLYEVLSDDNGNEYLNSVNSFEGLTFAIQEVRTFIITFKYNKDLTQLPEKTSVLGSIEFNFTCNVTSLLAQGSYATDSFFNGTISKDKIETITISPTMKVGSEALGSWDASLNGDGSVVAWYTDIDNDDLYELTLGCNKVLIAPENSSYLFALFSNVSEINLNGKLNTSSTTNMSAMFGANGALTKLDLAGIITNNVTDMSLMFVSCTNLLSLDLSSFNTANVTTMEYMFSECNALSDLKLLNTSFITDKVTSMRNMFYKCSSLTTLDLSGFNFSNVEDAGYMFSGCTNLSNLNAKFSFNNLTYIISMFENCSKITSLEFENFNTSGCDMIKTIFSNCTNLKSLIIKGFDISGITQSSWYEDIFSGCSSLTDLDISNSNFYNKNSISFKLPSSVKNLNMSNIDFSSKRSFTLKDLSKLETVNLTGFKLPADMSSFFYGCTNLKSIDFSSAVIQKLSAASSMFNGCSSLVNLDLSGFDISGVSTLTAMFSGCSSLISLDLSSFDTSSATSMATMFYNCSSLTSLDLSGFDTSSVTNMNGMFSGCSSLINLDLSGFDTSSISTISNFVYGCSSLKKLNISGFAISSSSFNLPSNLEELDISGADLYTNLFTYFSGLSNLKTINLSNTKLPQNMNNMFKNCTSLQSVDLSNSIFYGNAINPPSGMFYNCTSLVSVNLDGIYISGELYEMFYNCTSLKTINFGYLNSNYVTSYSDMFYNVPIDSDDFKAYVKDQDGYDFIISVLGSSYSSKVIIS